MSWLCGFNCIIVKLHWMNQAINTFIILAQHEWFLAFSIPRLLKQSLTGLCFDLFRCSLARRIVWREWGATRCGGGASTSGHRCYTCQPRRRNGRYGWPSWLGRCGRLGHGRLARGGTGSGATCKSEEGGWSSEFLAGDLHGFATCIILRYFAFWSLKKRSKIPSYSVNFFAENSEKFGWNCNLPAFQGVRVTHEDIAKLCRSVGPLAMKNDDDCTDIIWVNSKSIWDGFVHFLRCNNVLLESSLEFYDSSWYWM